jgi:xylulose-5-phosphate/fructose-6-phosphate phosphoketolase
VIPERLLDDKQYSARHGNDMPAISGWKWGQQGPAGARSFH